VAVLRVGDGENGLGCGPGTRVKLEQFDGLLGMHLGICGGLLKRWGGEWVYLDLTAGPGVYSYAGQPLTGMALRAVRAVHQRGLPYRAALIERRRDHYSCLRAEVDALAVAGAIDPARVAVLRGQSGLKAPSWLAGLPSAPAPLGFVVSDPNGEPDFPTLVTLSKLPVVSRLDYLLHVPTRTVKRVRRSAASGWIPNDPRPLHLRLADIRKQAWLIRAALGQQDWIYLIGTNWPGMPAWRRAGFVRLECAEGQAIMEGVSLTRKERREWRQMRLW
jgi:hypothetical protein